MAHVFTLDCTEEEIADSLYLDTSFLLGYFTGEEIGKRSKFKSTSYFLEKARSTGVFLYTSILTVQETAFVLIFRKNIFKRMEAVEKEKGFSFKSHKEFKQNYNKEYKKAFQDGVDQYKRFFGILLNTQISWMPHIQRDKRTEIYGLILREFQQNLDNCSMETADSLHLAIAKACGIRGIATWDRDYIVDNDFDCNVYCHQGHTRYS